MKVWATRLFFLFIFSLGFAQPSILIGGSRAPASDLLFLLTGFTLVGLLLSRSVLLKLDTAYLYLFAYAAALSLSVVFSLNLSTSGLKLVGELYLIALPVLVNHFVDDRRTLRATILTWITASGVVSVIGLVTVSMFYFDRSSSWHELFLHHYGSLPSGNYPRIQSTFYYPAMLANYLNVSVNLLLGAWFSGWTNKRVSVVLLAIHIGALAFTVTPGLGGTAITLCVWFGIWLNRRGYSALSAVSGAVGGLMGLVFLAAASVSIWPIATSPFVIDIFGVRVHPTQRMLTWIGSIETFLEHPLFGKGVGLPVANVRFTPPTGGTQILTDAHNSFLSVAANAGVVGLISFIALTLNVGRPRHATSEDLSPLNFALVFGFAVSFIYEGLFGSFENARHLWVLIGLIFAVRSMDRKEDQLS